MEALEAIMTRRSIRKYTHAPVSDEFIKTFLEAAMMAPSAGNQQPWHFIVVRDKITRLAIADYHPYAQMLREAPLAVIVCGDRRLEKHKDYWIQDCSAATENLLLAVHAKGLGAVWLGVHPREERITPTRKLFQLPNEVMPLAIIAIGYPAEIKTHPFRFDEGKVHYDQW
jgi:nitroreductase